MLAALIFSTLFALVVSDMVPKSDKTPEDKLGDAIAKYLKAGVKTQSPKD